jgi:hypothetical protein
MEEILERIEKTLTRMYDELCALRVLSRRIEVELGLMREENGRALEELLKELKRQRG